MTTSWLRRHRKILAWAAGSVALMLIALGVTGLALVRHLNDNIQQVNVADLLRPQPADLHPDAENILLIVSNTRLGADGRYGQALPGSQSSTLMLIHISADRKWAEVMAIPYESRVPIPACKTGDGQLSAPVTSKIDDAFRTADTGDSHAALGAACAVKTVEQDTGIYIDHFLVMNFEAFSAMVGALGGIQVCSPTAFTIPALGLVLSPGYHFLSPVQALSYARAITTIGSDSDLQRIARQEGFVAALLSRVKTQLYNPLAIYRFLDALTGSLTIDSQVGGITGLYRIVHTLRGVPASKTALFTLPTSPGPDGDRLLTQPADSEIFASLRNDTPASSSIFAAQAQATAAVSRPGKFGLALSAVSPPSSIPSSTVAQGACGG